MTEEQARAVLLVRSHELAPASAAWSADDAAWATRQAVHSVGEAAAPESFITTRAALALGRLEARDADGVRWARQRWQALPWLLGTAGLAFVAGLALDQLGPPERVNLLAPAVWALVVWNLVVCAWALWPRRSAPLPTRRVSAALARWLGPRLPAGATRPGLAAAWWPHALPLYSVRAAALLHLGAAGLAAGVCVGLYLRGLVLDYRAGWQSTFLDAGSVQRLLDLLLAPAAALTGISVPAVAPLQVLPGAAATGSAAPWIHLFAATLLLAVVLPRLLLALRSLWQARRLSGALALPLDEPDFEALHPLMQRQPRWPVRLLWWPEAALAADLQLMQATLPATGDWAEPLLLWRSPAGDSLELAAAEPAWRQGRVPARGWRTWLGLAASPEARAWVAAQRDTDIVLRVLPAGAAPAPSSALAAFGKPVLLLQDSAVASAPALPLRALDDGWLQAGALWQALVAACPDDRPLARAHSAWTTAQAQRLRTAACAIAQTLAGLALAREPLPAGGLFQRADPGAADAARQRLTQQLGEALTALALQLKDLWPAAAEQASGAMALPPRRRDKLGEGRAALLGGAVSGALAGLKADLATGGITLGAGALAGGVIGALGAAGVARGINSVRSVEGSQLDWGPAELRTITLALLKLPLNMAGSDPARADAALAASAADFDTAWAQRDNTLAQRLAPLLERTLQAAFGGPALPPPPGPDYTRAL